MIKKIQKNRYNVLFSVYLMLEVKEVNAKNGSKCLTVL